MRKVSDRTENMWKVNILTLAVRGRLVINILVFISKRLTLYCFLLEEGQ